MSTVADAATEAWLKSGKYLPRWMRDFQKQKDVFRAIDDSVVVRPEDLIKRPSWIEAQVYVIDVFLWYMARRGYTLQKTRRPGGYRDIEADVQERTAFRDERSTLGLKSMLSVKKAEE